MPELDSSVTRLANAGLLNPDVLTEADRDLINQLTTAEVEQLISIAKKLFADDPSIAKVTNVFTGIARIMIPL